MIIIGEKINGAIPKTAEAIAKRDDCFIRELVRMQEESGTDYLDVCAGTKPEEEYETLCWLIDVVQEEASKPICIDSPDPQMLIKVFPRIKSPGIINSVSGEGNKCDILLPLLREHPDWQVIALACDDNGVSASADDKVRISLGLIEKASKYGVGPKRIHIDPLVLALSAENSAAMHFCEAICRIKNRYPTVNITAALSNVSYGLPARNLLNTNFLTMAMMSGLDSVIADPANRNFMGCILATEALMGKDHCCRRYNKAYRAGKIGPPRK